jgi:hypothetical protein
MFTLSVVTTVPSVMVHEKVYTPSTETETEEFLELGLENVAVPGPEACVHRPVPVNGSFAFKVMENPQVD